MKHNMKKFISGLLLSMMLVGVVACGAQQGVLTDTAAVRGAHEGIDGVYIDDAEIALAIRAKTSAEADAAAMEAYDKTNEQREASGLVDLIWNVDLQNAAKVRAKEITSYFSHQRPDGSDFWTVDSRVMFGENLAKLYNSAEAVVTAWMNSSSHAANILAGDYVSIGIGVYEVNGQLYWAQEFGY